MIKDVYFDYHNTELEIDVCSWLGGLVLLFLGLVTLNRSYWFVPTLGTNPGGFALMIRPNRTVRFFSVSYLP